MPRGEDRGLIKNLARMVGTDVSTVKSFLGKAMTMSVKEYLKEVFGLTKPGAAWIPALKACIPIFWAVVGQEIPVEELARYLKEYVETGKVPEEFVRKLVEFYKNPEPILEKHATIAAKVREALAALRALVGRAVAA